MADKSSEPEDKIVDAEFELVLKNLVNTPHTPHVEKKEGREPKRAPEERK